MSINTYYQYITPYRLDLLIWNTSDDREAPARYIRSEGKDDDYDRPEPGIWTERNWVCLHALLTFGKWAEQPLLGESIAGGMPVGTGFQYASVRYLTAKQFSEIATALGAVEEEALRASCDPAVLIAANALPIDCRDDESFGHLWKTFVQIRDFFRMAQRDGYALLVYLG